MKICPSFLDFHPDLMHSLLECFFIAHRDTTQLGAGERIVIARGVQFPSRSNPSSTLVLVAHPNTPLGPSPKYGNLGGMKGGSGEGQIKIRGRVRVGLDES